MSALQLVAIVATRPCRQEPATHGRTTPVPGSRL